MNDELPVPTATAGHAEESTKSAMRNKNTPAAAGINMSAGGTKGARVLSDHTPNREVLADGEDAEQRAKIDHTLAPGSGTPGLGDGGGGGTERGGSASVGGDAHGSSPAYAGERFRKISGTRQLAEGAEMSDLEAQLRSPAKVCAAILPYFVP